MLAREILGIPLPDWGMALGTAALGFVLLTLLRRILIGRLTEFVARTGTSFDDLLIELVRRTKWYFLLTLAIWPAVRVLALAGGTTQVLRVFAVLAVTVQAVIWTGVVVTGLVGARLRVADPAATTTLGAVSFLIRVVLYAILLLLGLSNLGINVSALLTGLGIGGVAVALALQNVLGDLFASLSIVLDKPFVVGDFVVVGDMMGNVEHIGLKTTRVRSLSGEQIVMGNGDLLSSRIRNYKRMAQRRVMFSVGVVYQTPLAVLETLPATLGAIVTAEAGVRLDRAHLKAFDESAVTFEIVYYVLDSDYNRYMDTQQRILFGIVRRFERDGIAFAYPTRTIVLQPAGSQMA